MHENLIRSPNVLQYVHSSEGNFLQLCSSGLGPNYVYDCMWLFFNRTEQLITVL